MGTELKTILKSFVGHKIVGFTENEFGYLEGEGHGSVTLIFEDGRGLTFDTSEDTDVSVQTPEDIEKARKKLKRRLEQLGGGSPPPEKT